MIEWCLQCVLCTLMCLGLLVPAVVLGTTWMGMDHKARLIVLGGAILMLAVMVASGMSQ